MLVVKGKYSGFCFGVKRAVDEAEKLSGKNNYILGEIIHNERVIESLKKKGIKTINSLDEVEFDVKDKLLIRTHGESKETFEKAKNLGVELLCATVSPNNAYSENNMLKLGYTLNTTLPKYGSLRNIFYKLI